VIATVKRAEDFLDWVRREGGDSADPALARFRRRHGRCRAPSGAARRAHRELRPKEYALLVALLKRGGRVASRLELLREVWGYAEDVMSRTVDDTHVAMLRRKLEHDPAHPRHIVTSADLRLPLSSASGTATGRRSVRRSRPALHSSDS